MSQAYMPYLSKLLSLTVGLLLAEGLCRLIGLGPYQPAESGLAYASPATYFEADSLLGYKLSPGNYQLCYQNGFSFEARHDSLGHRVTQAQPLAHKLPLYQFYGCSFTYGQGLHDDQSYPYKLQAMLPAIEIVNKAVPGYGIHQSWLQMQAAMRAGERPQKIILAYASFHDERNTFCRQYRKKLIPSQPFIEEVVFPYLHKAPRAEEAYQYDYRPYAYEHFVGAQHSAILHLLERIYDRLQYLLLGSRRYSYALIHDMARLCEAHQIDFVLAGVMPDVSTRRLLRYFEQEGLTVVDISVDLTEPGQSLAPYDSHPSELAHRHYADQLADFFQQDLLSVEVD